MTGSVGQTGSAAGKEGTDLQATRVPFRPAMAASSWEGAVKLHAEADETAIAAVQRRRGFIFQDEPIMTCEVSEEERRKETK